MPSTHATEHPHSTVPGTLFLVATPIGNLADITLRALDTLRSVDLIAAEDTRHTRKLLTHFDIHKPLVSYHSENVKYRGFELIRRLKAGQSVALVTDAGTPAISDPGAMLVQQVIEEELPLVVIPGPTALITALVQSGLPTHPFAFLGFPPARGTGRRRFFSSYASLPMTLILYESPQRLIRTLQDILQFWGNRPIAVARELTKKFEEIFRGPVEDAILRYSQGTKGELCITVGGFPEALSCGSPRVSGPQLESEQELGKSICAETISAAEGLSWQEVLHQRLLEGETVKEVSDLMARRYLLSRRTVYQEALRVKQGLSAEMAARRQAEEDENHAGDRSEDFGGI